MRTGHMTIDGVSIERHVEGGRGVFWRVTDVPAARDYEEFGSLTEAKARFRERTGRHVTVPRLTSCSCAECRDQKNGSGWRP